MIYVRNGLVMLLSCLSLSAGVSAAGGEALAGLGAPQEIRTEENIVTNVPETEASSLDVSQSRPVDGSLPNIDLGSWEMILANASHPIGEYAPQTQELEGIELDYRIIDAMEAFVEDAREEGLPVYLSSGYRDYYTQDYLNQLQQSYGYSKEEADKIVAPAGTSEHQTGLACDITDYYREFKNDELEDTDTYKWMSAHCQEYGFIVRYPKGKDAQTGIIYEPWHYRYVGKEAAEYIMSHNLCLEEFLALYQ